MDPSDRSCFADPAAAVLRRGGGALLIALVLLLSPTIAAAQNPFQPLPSQPSQTVTTAPAPVTSSPTTTAGNLSGNEQVGLIAAGIVLIAAIAFLIRRDARAKAPVAARAGSSAQRATVAPRAKRIEQSRAKAKAGRRQRKRARGR